MLRPARPEDADAIAKGFQEDPTMGAMLGMEPEQENAEWLRGTFPPEDQDGEQPASCWFAIDDPATGELIGEIGLVGISRPNRRAALSVLVLPRFRRAGAGREAIELLVGWAQDELDLHRVELHTYPENVAMQRLAEAAGFQPEGVLRGYSFERGRFMDNVVYARLRSPGSPVDLAGGGWTLYAPLGAEPAVCTFCGEPRRPRQRLIANADGSAAICENCVTRFGGFVSRTPGGEHDPPSG